MALGGDEIGVRLNHWLGWVCLFVCLLCRYQGYMENTWRMRDNSTVSLNYGRTMHAFVSK